MDVSATPSTTPDPLGPGFANGVLGRGRSADVAQASAAGLISRSDAVTASEVVNIPFPVLAQLSWDGYWRAVYEKANRAIQQQANELLRRGNVTAEEARELIEVQRNRLVIEMRKPLTPFGRFYSETLKPSSSLPTLEQLLRKKGSIEAILTSVGKTRAVTNRLAVVGRTAGPAGILLEISLVGVVIDKAPPNERARVATEEIGGAAGGLLGGRVGMLGGGMAGAAWAGTWAAPTLVIPVVGEITEGTAVPVGGFVGGMLGAWAAHDATKAAIHDVWTLAAFEWR